MQDQPQTLQLSINQTGSQSCDQRLDASNDMEAGPSGHHFPYDGDDS